jgi:hypothetical protein
MWMAPLLVSALVGIGVKIASDVVVAGAKRIFKFGGGAAPFAATLDQARGAAPATPSAASTGPLRSLDPAASDRSRVLADAVVAPPSASRAQGVAAYQRLDEIPQQAV